MYTRFVGVLLVLLMAGCSPPLEENTVETVTGHVHPNGTEIWLTHEHLLVDFIGAESISAARWNRDSVAAVMLPFLQELKLHNVAYFVDATPNYLGRDVALLERMARETGLNIITNTGLYGAVKNKYIPANAFEKSAEELAEMWISEYENGIEGTSIKPGFIKISVDPADTLHPMHTKLVEAAALTHLRTGLTIASHTGEAKGLWPQLEILQRKKVSPDAFIWVHAQLEPDNSNYLKAAALGCWISLDGLGWELEQHVEKLVFAREHKILDRILISHDAGWYDPQKRVQDVKPYTAIFTALIPALQSRGFSEGEINLLLCENPARAFSVKGH